MRVIQAFAQEDTTQRSFEVVNRANRDVNVRAVSLSYTFLPSVNILSIAATCIVLGVGGVMVVLAVGPEAEHDRRGFDRAVRLAEERLKEIEG